MRVTTIDLSEGGMAVSVPRGRRPNGKRQIVFTLPGTETALSLLLSLLSDVGTGRVSFQQIAPEATHQLREWLKQNSPTRSRTIHRFAASLPI